MPSYKKRRAALRVVEFEFRAKKALDACTSIEEVEALARDYARWARAALWHRGFAVALGAAQAQLLIMGARNWDIGTAELFDQS